MLRRGQRFLMHAENNILIQRNVIKDKNCVSMAILSPDHHERILYSGLMLKRNLLRSSSDPVPPYRTRSLWGHKRGAHPEPGSSRNSLSEQPGPPFGHVQAFTLGSFSQGRWILLLLGPQDSQATVWGGGGQSLDLLVGVNNVCVRPVWLWEGQKWKGKRVGCDGRLALFSIPYSGAELWGAWAF